MRLQVAALDEEEQDSRRRGRAAMVRLAEQPAVLGRLASPGHQGQIVQVAAWRWSWPMVRLLGARRYAEEYYRSRRPDASLAPPGGSAARPRADSGAAVAGCRRHHRGHRTRDALVEATYPAALKAGLE